MQEIKAEQEQEEKSRQIHLTAQLQHANVRKPRRIVQSVATYAASMKKVVDDDVLMSPAETPATSTSTHSLTKLSAEGPILELADNESDVTGGISETENDNWLDKNAATAASAKQQGKATKQAIKTTVKKRAPCNAGNKPKVTKKSVKQVQPAVSPLVDQPSMIGYLKTNNQGAQIFVNCKALASVESAVAVAQADGSDNESCRIIQPEGANSRQVAAVRPVVLKKEHIALQPGMVSVFTLACSINIQCTQCTCRGSS